MIDVHLEGRRMIVPVTTLRALVLAEAERRKLEREHHVSAALRQDTPGGCGPVGDARPAAAELPRNAGTR